MKKLFGLFIIFSFFLCSCVTILENRQSQVFEEQLKFGDYTKRVDIFLNQIQTIEDSDGEKFNVIADNQFNQTGLFKNPEPNNNPQITICPAGKPSCADQKTYRKIFVDFYQVDEFSKTQAIFSILTLLIYPVKESHVFRIKAVVLDETGKNLKTYEFDDSYAQWFELFLLPASPFQGIFIDQKIAKNLIDTLILKAYSDHLLN